MKCGKGIDLLNSNYGIQLPQFFDPTGMGLEITKTLNYFIPGSLTPTNHLYKNSGLKDKHLLYYCQILCQALKN